MCEYCNQTPHHNMCPNASPRKAVGVCSVCGQEIIEGDKIYRLVEGEAIHDDCIQGFTPEEVFRLLDIDISNSFRYSDIDGEVFLELLGIRKEYA